jgi:hypothetical protein
MQATKTKLNASSTRKAGVVALLALLFAIVGVSILILGLCACGRNASLDATNGGARKCGQCVDQLIERRALVEFAGEDDVVSFDVSQSKLKDADLACLRDCKKIKHLFLIAPNIDGSCLQYFADTPTIETLQMGGAPLRRAEDLRYIGGMKNLWQLTLSGNVIDDKCLRFLDDLHKLVALELNDTRVSDSGMKHIAALKQLDRLKLNETLVGDEGVKELSELPKLTSLNIQYTKISDRATEYLARMKTLKILSLYGTEVSGPGLDAVARLPNLELLDLRKTKISQKVRCELMQAKPGLTVYGPEMWD